MLVIHSAHIHSSASKQWHNINNIVRLASTQYVYVARFAMSKGNAEKKRETQKEQRRKIHRHRGDDGKIFYSFIRNIAAITSLNIEMPIKEREREK